MAVKDMVGRAVGVHVDELKSKLHPRIRRLIQLANWDLNYGPSMEGQDDDENSEDGSKVKYPGFVNACTEISNALEVSDIWIDIQTEEVLTKEPEGYFSENPDFDPDEEDCEATVWVDVSWEDITKLDSSEVKTALLGYELAQHC